MFFPLLWVPVLADQLSYKLRDSLFRLGRPALGVNVPRAILVKAVEVLLIRFRFRYGTARFVSLLVNPKKTLAIRFHRSRRTKTIEIESRNIVVLPWRFRRIAQTKPKFHVDFTHYNS